MEYKNNEFKKPPPLSVGDNKPAKNFFWGVIVLPWKDRVLSGAFFKFKFGKGK